MLAHTSQLTPCDHCLIQKLAQYLYWRCSDDVISIVTSLGFLNSCCWHEPCAKCSLNCGLMVIMIHHLYQTALRILFAMLFNLPATDKDLFEFNPSFLTMMMRVELEVLMMKAI
uniref:Ovule protein n=1 Tax=Panagrellus redivivus TaxID=6233 RepID=A0A7E4W1K0_PANRE